MSFHPKCAIAAVKDDTLEKFLRAPVTGDLSDIPGIGPHAINKLNEGEEPITTTH